MRAVQYASHGAPMALVDLPEPTPPPGAAVLAVEATGLCRSDVHAWLGHDDVPLPHVPGHELVGRVVGVGAGVDAAWLGRRATTPFVCACGTCPECRAGDGQVCRRQSQPGFTHAGSWAERVVVHHAAVNLVDVGEDVDAGAAALLGCRFATAHRALAAVARVQPGEAVLVLGCGGVGLSAVLVAAALGARVVAADVVPGALARARSLGAAAGAAVDAVDVAGLAPEQVAAAVRDLGGDLADGVAVALEASGRAASLAAGLLSLARRGRHVQVGLLEGDPVVPVPRVVSHELALLGSHGMDARGYPALLALVRSGRLDPGALVSRWVGLADLPAAAAAMAAGGAGGGVVVARP